MLLDEKKNPNSKRPFLSRVSLAETKSKGCRSWHECSLTRRKIQIVKGRSFHECFLSKQNPRVKQQPAESWPQHHVKSRELSLPTPQTSANFDNTRVSKRFFIIKWLTYPSEGCRKEAPEETKYMNNITCNRIEREYPPKKESTYSSRSPYQ